MITLNKSSKNALTKALARANENGLRCEWTGVVGSYRVSSASEPGRWHMVTFGKENGLVEALCTCEGHERGRVCQHVGMALAAEKERLIAAHATTCVSCRVVEVDPNEALCEACLHELTLQKDHDDLFGEAA